MSFQTRLLPGHLDLTELCKNRPEQYPYALISTSSSEARQRDRYDIIFAYPQESLILDKDHRLAFSGEQPLAEDTGFLDSLNRWWQKEKIAPQNSELPFTGGWFVFLAYEIAGEIEPTLKLPEKPEFASNKAPLAVARRCPAAIIVDHLEHTVTAIAEDEYAGLLDQIEKDVLQAAPPASAGKQTRINAGTIYEAPDAAYLAQVAKIRQYIIDGDIFQANLSRLWSIEIDDKVSDVDIFNALSRSNPGSFAALARLGDVTLISSSPERLVHCRNNVVQTRPIAGTRPRSAMTADDAAMTRELLAHPKERAEHVMLIDLERNDLGRVCKPGSVVVDELMVLESYQHVHHIVSNIRGNLQDQLTPVDVIKAVFPGGTITGCPKVRCMEILAELEQQQRGAYTGSLGYINRDGSMDLNILIRTMVRAGDKISFRAGGGIVADSVPQHELDETRAKAKGLVNIFNLNR